MLSLPSTIRLDRDMEMERLLLDKARAFLEREVRQEGIHASDLLDLRQAYWRRKKPLPISDRLVPIFLIGKILHAFILNALDGLPVELAKTDEGSFYCKELGIYFSPDKILSNTGEPAEVKTSRSYYEPKDAKDIDFYLEQELIYQVALDVTTGKIWVLFLNLKDEKGRTAPQFRCYNVKVTKKELAAYKEQLKEAIKKLKWSLANKEHRNLPLCREFKCGRNNCEWYDDCKPEERYGTPKFDEGKKTRIKKELPPISDILNGTLPAQGPSMPTASAVPLRTVTMGRGTMPPPPDIDVTAAGGGGGDCTLAPWTSYRGVNLMINPPYLVERGTVARTSVVPNTIINET